MSEPIAKIPVGREMPLRITQHMIATLSRFPGRFRVALTVSRLFMPRGKVVLHHVNGERMVFDFSNKHEIAMYFDLFAPELSRILKRVLKPGSVFLDCGANIGYFSFLASPIVGEAGCVLSIDANPYCIKRIQESKRNGDYANVKVVEAAVGNGQGKLDFHVADDPMYSSFSNLNELNFTRTSSTIKVSLIKIDDLLDQHCDYDKNVKLMKIDVEGAELDTLQGTAHWLSLHRIEYIYLELHRKQLQLLGKSDQDVIGLLRSHGYLLEATLNHSTYLYKAP